MAIEGAVLNRYEIIDELIRTGCIENVTESLVNVTSMDVTLGEEILEELPPAYTGEMRCMDLRSREPLETNRIRLGAEAGYILKPGEFILACSQQIFHMPLNISAEFKLKSSVARVGIEHLNAGWCDPGWHGSRLTMEIKNMTRFHRIRIRPGDRIGQMVFLRNKLVEQGYEGRYNNDRTVKGIKP